MKTTVSQTETTTESAAETITTSFPLGLFCNATLSSPLPKTTTVKTSSTNRKIHHKPKNLLPIDPESKGWMETSGWTIAPPPRES